VLQLISASIVMGTDGYGTYKVIHTPCSVDAPLSLTSFAYLLCSYPRVSRLQRIHRIRIRQLLRLARRPRCVGFPDVLCRLDNSDRHLPPGRRHHLRGSCLHWLRSCRRRGRGCPLMARWFHCCGG
jgi:hypothetical protein